MIPVEEALQIILKNIQVLGLEKVDILDSLGRLLGEEIYAPYHIPHWNNSAMDGYAVIQEDIENASSENPAVLKVVADLPAGYTIQKELKRGEAIRIMTGAPMPEGSDTVVMVEDTRKDGNQVKIFKVTSKGGNIRKAGEDVRKGALVLSPGSVLRPAGIGMLASLKRSFISVYQRPTVAVISTGDELIDVDGDLAGGKIVSSNTYSLSSLVKDAGATPLILGIARDKSEELRERFKVAIRADMIISSGGVSVGDYDLVKDILKELGADMKFWKVTMRPGQPLAFGVIKDKPSFGLPGNPVSCMVSFEQFVRPSILKMSGHTRIFRPLIEARLKDPIKKKEGKKYFIRCIVSREKGEYSATTTGEQGSGILMSMVRANGLIVLPEEKTSFETGETVKVQLLDRGFELNENPEYC